MPEPMRYIPLVNCARCGRAVNLITRERKSKQPATLWVYCHGAKEQVQFTEQPGVTIEAFHDQADRA